jgi:hypothetical protein
MKFGAFLMPTHPPEQSIRDGQLRDLRDLEIRSIDPTTFSQ